MSIVAGGKTPSNHGSDKQLTPGPSTGLSEENQDKVRIIYMLVNHLGIAFRDEEHRVEVFAELELLTYTQLIRPLVIKDRKKKMSLGQLMRKYRCSKNAVRYILENC